MIIEIEESFRNENPKLLMVSKMLWRKVSTSTCVQIEECLFEIQNSQSTSKVSPKLKNLSEVSPNEKEYHRNGKCVQNSFSFKIWSKLRCLVWKNKNKNRSFIRTCRQWSDTNDRTSASSFPTRPGMDWTKRVSNEFSISLRIVIWLIWMQIWRFQPFSSTRTSNLFLV